MHEYYDGLLGYSWKEEELPYVDQSTGYVPVAVPSGRYVLTAGPFPYFTSMAGEPMEGAPRAGYLIEVQ
jgi:hypothetical protein